VRKHVGDLFAALQCDTRTLIAVRWRAAGDGEWGGGERQRRPAAVAESSLL
jgi:hypothetical protein